MYRIDGPGATVDNKFTEGDPVGGVQATVVTDDFLNDVQEELISVLAGAGVTPEKGTQDQVLQAIYKLAQSQKATAFPAGGTATALTLAPTPAITAYAANQRFTVKFPVNSGVNPTLNVSAKGAKSLKQYDSTGAKVSAVFAAGQISDVEYDGTDLVVLNPLPQNLTPDIWAMQPIGALIALIDTGSVQAPPRGSSAYTYLRLTASDAYNAPNLTNESISGSQPLLLATGVVSLAGSPFNGSTIRLINTERRVLRAGLPGVVEQDALQNITGTFGGAEASASTTGAFSNGVNFGTVGPGGSNRSVINFDASLVARTATETRVKSMGVTYYLRIK